MQTTENTKKAVRLEDKIAEAQAGRAAAKSALAAKEASIAAALAEAKREEHVADLHRLAMRKAHERSMEETRKRLGLTPAAAKKAVLAWAGLTPAEEDEAVIRGDTGILDSAVERLVRHVVRQDAVMITAKKALDAAEKVHTAKYNARQSVEFSLRDEEHAVRRFDRLLRELDQKVTDRDKNKAKAAATPKKQISKEDQARFVEARRRLTLAANGRERGSWNSAWYDESASHKAKLDPPFVWPPKEKV